MSRPCCHYRCGQRAVRAVAPPITTNMIKLGPASLVPNSARIHAYCSMHADKIERRLRRYFYA